MRAALLSGPRDLAMVSLEDPKPGPGEALVRVEANAICGSDLSTYRGTNPRGSFPTVMGHEIAGTVVGTGEGVDRELEGVRVCIEPNRCCNACRYCRQGLPNICPDYHVLGESMAYQGGCAELVSAPVTQVFPLPEGVSILEGALVQPLAISYSGVIQRGQVAGGERVLVLGAGPIGLGALLLAQLRGAQVLVADLVDQRLDLALQLGAQAALRADDADWERRALEFTDGEGFDLSIEAVGGAQTRSLDDAHRLTRPRGRIVVMGSFAERLVPFPSNGMKNREHQVMGSIGHPGSFAPVIDLLAAGRLRAAEMVTHRMGLEQLPEAFDMLDAKRDGAVKIVIEP